MGKSDILRPMDGLLFHPEQAVDDVLQTDQRLAGVFFHNQTACVECYLARFCTLKDVANTYNLNLENLLVQLQQAIHPHPINPKKESSNENMV